MSKAKKKKNVNTIIIVFTFGLVERDEMEQKPTGLGFPNRVSSTWEDAASVR